MGWSSERKWIAALCVVQFFHWFKTSEPVLYGILSDDLDLNRHQILDQVFAWSVYWEPLSYVASLLTYKFAGYRVALLLVTVLNFVTVVLLTIQVKLNINTGYWYILACVYELTWTGGFAILFVMACAMYEVLPCEHFQEATSSTRSVALVSTVTSSLLGSSMAVTVGKISTLYVSLACTFLSLVALLFFFWCGWMPAQLPNDNKHNQDPSGTDSRHNLQSLIDNEDEAEEQRDDANQDNNSGSSSSSSTSTNSSSNNSSNSKASAKTDLLTHSSVGYWIFLIAAVLAVHVIVMTQIQGLVKDTIKDGSNLFGFIQAVAYLFAVGGTLLPVLCPSFMARVAVPCAGLATVGMSVVLLWIWSYSGSTSVLVMGLTFTLYHGAAEFTVVLGKAELGKLLQARSGRKGSNSVHEQVAAKQSASACKPTCRDVMMVVFFLVFLTSWAIQFALTKALPSSKFQTYKKFFFYAIFLFVSLGVSATIYSSRELCSAINRRARQQHPHQPRRTRPKQLVDPLLQHTHTDGNAV